jgi:hypothetical protein
VDLIRWLLRVVRGFDADGAVTYYTNEPRLYYTINESAHTDA